MLTKFAAALLATSLIASSALAAHPAAPTGSNSGMPAAQTQVPSKPAATSHKVGKTVKSSVKHATRHRSHARKHVARGKSHAVHHARHAKPTKTHQVGMAKGAGRSERERHDAEKWAPVVGHDQAWKLPAVRN